MDEYVLFAVEKAISALLRQISCSLLFFPFNLILLDVLYGLFFSVESQVLFSGIKPKRLHTSYTFSLLCFPLFYFYMYFFFLLGTNE